MIFMFFFLFFSCKIYFWVALHSSVRQMMIFLRLFLALLLAKCCANNRINSNQTNVIANRTVRHKEMDNFIKKKKKEKTFSFRLFVKYNVLVKFIVYSVELSAMEKSGHAWIPKQISCEFNLLHRVCIRRMHMCEYTVRRLREFLDVTGFLKKKIKQNYSFISPAQVWTGLRPDLCEVFFSLLLRCCIDILPMQAYERIASPSGDICTHKVCKRSHHIHRDSMANCGHH